MSYGSLFEAEDWANCAPKTLDLSNFTGRAGVESVA